MFSSSFLNNSNLLNLKAEMNRLGIDLDVQTGHISYKDNFIPIELYYDLVFIRHGETYGNCGQSSEDGSINYFAVEHKIKDVGKRIFQGFVDETINQLTQEGKDQAVRAANQLDSQFIKRGWLPDFIISSPLRRAKDTAKPFIQIRNMRDNFIIDNDIREMNFGAWENKRVCDFDPEDACHSFYLSQNALIKSNGEAENFCEVVSRAHKVLLKFNEMYSGKKLVMYSHSMFGAACYILCGKGQYFDNKNYLAFDGKNSDGLSYTIPNATPFILNEVEKPMFTLSGCKI